jgi:hypothetical protein
MNLIGMMLVRNEDWCLGLSLRVALRWCDSVVVMLHACTDRSSEIVSEIQAEAPGRVHVLVVSETSWFEMIQRQDVLRDARELGATHVAIIDADEVLTGNLLPTIRGTIHDTPANHIAFLPGYNLRGGIDRYHSSGVWGNRWFSVAFRDSLDLHWAGDRFHHREPMGKPLTPWRPVAQGQGGVMHLWGASERRLRAKHALYKLAERIRWPEKPVPAIDAQYSLAIKDTGWRFSPTPECWWNAYRDLMPYLHVDAEPWQEEECRRLVSQYPGVESGFDLFGVTN